MKCDACFRGCDIPEGGTGFCRARSCRHGQIVPDNYGRLTALALDPIEKKPLRDFYPGSLILSAGSWGCNMRCPFCQNHEISQHRLDQAPYVSPQALVSAALDKTGEGSIGIAFTYNEPLTGWEYVRDAGRLAKQAGLKTVVVTNGTASLQVLEEILPWTDAFNIDLKGFTPQAHAACGGSLEATRAFIERAAQDAHVELTSLIVPGLNDGKADMEAQARWIASIDPGIPLHITRYFPGWTSHEAPTSIALMKELQQVAQQHLDKVYLGNI